MYMYMYHMCIYIYISRVSVCLFVDTPTLVAWGMAVMAERSRAKPTLRATSHTPKTQRYLPHMSHNQNLVQKW